MDIREILKYNSSYAFRLAFFSIDFQNKYAQKLQLLFPDALLKEHLLTECDKNLIDIDAIAGSLDISVEEIVSQTVYEFSSNDINVYVSPYFIYGVVENGKGESELNESFVQLLRSLNGNPVDKASPSSLTFILNVMGDMSRVGILSSFQNSCYPIMDWQRFSGGRYVESIRIEDSLNLDIIRNIEKNENEYRWQITLNENLFFQRMNQIDALDVASRMFEECKNEVVKLFKC